MNVHVTTHAVERFQERHAPTLSMREARARLEEIARMAAPLKTRTGAGQALWKAGEIALVMKRDSGEFICVTVLPPEESRASIADDLERELAEESKRDIEEMRRRIADEQLPPWNLIVLDGASIGKLIEVINRQLQAINKSNRSAARVQEQARIAEAARAAKHARHLELLRAQRQPSVDKQTIGDAKRIIRIAVRALLDHETEMAGAALAAIGEIEPAYLTPDFLDAVPANRDGGA